MKTDISHFDQLPNSAMVSVKVFSALISAAESTIWRRAKLEPDFPQPNKLGEKCTRFKVGNIRKLIASEVA
jgi:predicted DNA-binding transcriptional regulator AlpA